MIAIMYEWLIPNLQQESRKKLPFLLLQLRERLLDELGNPVEACLPASIDDATGKITHAYFDFNEGVACV